VSTFSGGKQDKYEFKGKTLLSSQALDRNVKVMGELRMTDGE